MKKQLWIHISETDTTHKGLTKQALKEILQYGFFGYRGYPNNEISEDEYTEIFDKATLQEHLSMDRWLFSNEDDEPNNTFFYGTEEELEDYLETYKNKYDTKKEDLVFKKGK